MPVLYRGPSAGMGESNVFRVAYRNMIQLIGNPAYETLSVFFNGDFDAGLTLFIYLQGYEE